MYRTYRELYRSKTEIRSIGKGPGQVRIGRSGILTVDVLVVGLLAMVFPGSMIGLVVQIFDPALPTFITAGLVGFLLGFLVSKANLQGKAAWSWLLDGLLYLIRSKWHNGWRRLDFTPSLRWIVKIYAVENGTAYATPAAGLTSSFVLHKESGVAVHKGIWRVTRSQRGFFPGRYRIKNGRAVPDTAPRLRRGG